MNPLDKAELGNFDERIQKEMPFISSKKVSVPGAFGNFPNDLMGYSANVDGKFLNKYQHIIEEILHRDPNNKTAKYFLNYHDRYFGKYGILKGDGIFHKILNSKHKALARMGNIPSVFVIFGGPHTNGATLSTGDTVSTFANQSGKIFAFLQPSATVDTWYDSIAQNYFIPSGNQRIGAYDNAFNLYSESGSVAIKRGFQYVTVPEFKITNASVYTAIQVNNDTAQIFEHTSGGTRKYLSQSYGAFANPLAGYSSDSENYNQRMRHTTGNSDEFVTGYGGADLGSFGKDTFQAYRCYVGPSGYKFNRMALQVTSASGSIKLGVYNNSGSAPNNLKASVSGFAAVTNDYSYHSFTEFTLDTDVVWLAFNNTATGMHPADDSSGESDTRQYTTEAYGTSFSDPAPGGLSTGNDTAVMKIGHT